MVRRHAKLDGAMQLDVVDLRDFYASPLGLTVRRVVGQQIRTRWRGVRGGSLMGLGYGVPYLGAYRSDVTRLGALMPDTQGAIVWPPAGPLLSVLVADDQLPLPDGSVDRMLVAHSLEVSERPTALLREIWRVLTPEGRLLIVVPNRRSVWARIDSTPFGQGRPFSKSQLEKLLVESLFSPVSSGTALHMPPLNWRLVLKSARVWERLGSKLWPTFGGVLIVEARKEVVAPIAGKRVAARGLRELVTARPARALGNTRAPASPGPCS
jgi:SAM-dependent methyltransferase